jgi:hypothetical protein
MPNSNIESLYYHPGTTKLEWRCKYCPKRYTINGGTRVIKLHLTSVHGIIENSPRQERIIQRQRTIEEAVAFGQENPRKRRYIDTDIALDDSQFIGSICPSTLERLYIDFQTSCNLPIALVQNTSFRNLIRYINPVADNVLPESPSTAKALLMEQFSKGKEAIRQRLQEAQTSIHLSLDSWTAGNHLPILGIIAHAISEHQLEEYVIALRVIQGRHTGENLASIVLDVLQEYGITHQLGYIQMDNASNNDTLMAALSSGMFPF